MTDKFFRPMKKGKIYHSIDWEGMLQYVKEIPESFKLGEAMEIDLLCSIAKARALDNIYHSGLLTTTA